MRRTRDPRIWLQYACWCVQFWMSGHRPLLPNRLRWWCRHLFPDQRRHHVTREQYRFWLSGRHNDPATLPKPLPWPFEPHFVGPFYAPWKRVERWFRAGTGGRSHRCEFTDREHGALWGHREGAFMDRLFDRFVERIEA